LLVGKYLCFSKGNWEQGLPMLAQCDNEKARSLALRDLKGAETAKEQLELGDAWWDICKSRAVYWYEQALPSLSGLEKIAVEKKLANVQPNSMQVAIANAAIGKDRSTLQSPGTKAPYQEFLADLMPTAFEILGGSPPKDCRQHPVFGKNLQHGLWAHPPAAKQPSRVVFELNGRFSLLNGVAAIADGAKPASPLIFKVDGNGKTLWHSPPTQKAGMAIPFRVRVSNVQTLILYVECPGSHDGGWAYWVDPVLTKKRDVSQNTTSAQK
jgi:hypothetical protein